MNKELLEELDKLIDEKLKLIIEGQNRIENKLDIILRQTKRI